MHRCTLLINTASTYPTDIAALLDDAKYQLSCIRCFNHAAAKTAAAEAAVDEQQSDDQAKILSMTGQF